VPVMNRMLGNLVLRLDYFFPLFHHLTCFSASNWNIHINFTVNWEQSSKNTDSLKFRLSIAQGLMQEHGSGVPRPVHCCLPNEPPPKRLKERHFLKHIPTRGKKARLKRKCVVCKIYGKIRESIYWCSECKAGLCLDRCFKNQTNLNF
jgi:hypothetical protein